MKRKKRALYERQRGNCHYCGNYFPFHKITFDHVIRKRDGGSNRMENLVLACLPCNQYREMDNASEYVKAKFIQRQREALLCGTFQVVAQYGKTKISTAV